ncbi:hypothetical protein [Rubrivirga sp. IMCC43871]|uniref:hypothetical protein n=1 Tax=Rubrivirga sp. IMCC43871 TaxID=3391575 RepID=UPI00398F932D
MSTSKRRARQRWEKRRKDPCTSAHAFTLLDHVESQVRLFDTKASLLLAGDAVLIGTILEFANDRRIGDPFAVIPVSFLVVALLCSIMSVRPSLGGRHRAKSPPWWGARFSALADVLWFVTIVGWSFFALWVWLIADGLNAADVEGCLWWAFGGTAIAWGLLALGGVAWPGPACKALAGKAGRWCELLRGGAPAGRPSPFFFNDVARMNSRRFVRDVGGHLRGNDGPFRDRVLLAVHSKSVWARRKDVLVWWAVRMTSVGVLIAAMSLSLGWKYAPENDEAVDPSTEVVNGEEPGDCEEPVGDGGPDGTGGGEAPSGPPSEPAPAPLTPDSLANRLGVDCWCG